MVIRTRTRLALALCAALVAGSATALVPDEATLDSLRAQFKQCQRLPGSQVEMCVLQRQAEFKESLAAAPMNAAQRATLDQAEARYQSDYAACGKLSDSQKDICRARAQAARSEALKIAVAQGSEPVAVVAVPTIPEPSSGG